MFRLDGQVAIITGGAQGIGEGICEVFCQAGATVALWDIRPSGQETAERIKASGGNIFFQSVDVTDRKAVDSVVQEIIDAYGNRHPHQQCRYYKIDRFSKWNKKNGYCINVNLNTVHHPGILPMREAGYGQLFQPLWSMDLPGLVDKPIGGQQSRWLASTLRETGRFGTTANAVAPDLSPQ